MTTDNDSVRNDFFDWMEGRRKESASSDPRYLEVWQASRERYVPDPCEWLQDEWDNSYDTSCGNKYEIIEGTPEDNGMNYCTYCGGKLEAITTETQGKHEQ